MNITKNTGFEDISDFIVLDQNLNRILLCYIRLRLSNWQKDYLKFSKEIYCSIRGKKELIEISKLPFVKTNYKRSNQ